MGRTAAAGAAGLEYTDEVGATQAYYQAYLFGQQAISQMIAMTFSTLQAIGANYAQAGTQARNAINQVVGAATGALGVVYQSTTARV